MIAELSALILIIGGSFSAESFGTPSAGRIFAERIGAPYAVYAHAGKKMHEVMPPDALIRDAAMVISPDGFYWYSNRKEDCDHSVEVANHLFDVRAGRPMILATVPWGGGKCVNPVLVERCVDACILIKAEGEMEPPGLHPNEAWMRKSVDKLYGR